MRLTGHVVKLNILRMKLNISLKVWSYFLEKNVFKFGGEKNALYGKAKGQ